MAAASDGPFVVTHLVRLRPARESDKCVCRLPAPVAIIHADAGGDDPQPPPGDVFSRAGETKALKVVLNG